MYAVLAATRFLLELATLGAVSAWGYQLGTGRSTLRIALAVAFPLVVAGAWATFGAPAASHRLDAAARVALETAVLGLGAVGLAVVGHRSAAVAFLAVALVTGVALRTMEAG